jgi:endonuclease III
MSKKYKNETTEKAIKDFMTMTKKQRADFGHNKLSDAEEKDIEVAVRTIFYNKKAKRIVDRVLKVPEGKNNG